MVKTLVVLLKLSRKYNYGLYNLMSNSSQCYGVERARWWDDGAGSWSLSALGADIATDVLEI